MMALREWRVVYLEDKLIAGGGSGSAVTARVLWDV